MKVGDLVKLSAKGSTQDQNFMVNEFCSFGIVVSTQYRSGYSPQGLLYEVQWFPKKQSHPTHKRKCRHWRYELKHHKKTRS